MGQGESLASCALPGRSQRFPFLVLVGADLSLLKTRVELQERKENEITLTKAKEFPAWAAQQRQLWACPGIYLQPVKETGICSQSSVP